MKEEKIRVLALLPTEYAKMVTIDNTLEAMQQFVGGLIECLPELGSSQAGGRTELPEIPGVVPSIWELGSGCAFRARCREAQPRCASEAPPLVALDDPSHGVACWLHAPATRIRAHTEALA